MSGNVPEVVPLIDVGGGEVLHASENRVLSLIQHIDAHPYQTEEELAEWLDVEASMLGQVVDAASRLLPPGVRIVRDPAGLAFEAKDRASLSAWLRAMQTKAGAPSSSPATPEERLSFLLGELISRRTWITIDALADLMFCSRRTVSNDLKAVEDKLRAFGLELEKRPHYGIRIVGTEMERRIGLGSILMDRLNLSDGTTRGDGQEAGSDPYGIERISASVERIKDRMGFAIRPIAFQNLVVHIAVAVARLKGGHVLPKDNLGGFVVEDQRVKGVAQAISDEIGLMFDISLPEVEVDYIALHLSGKRTSLPAVQLDGAHQAESAPGASADELAAQMIEAVYRSFHVDLRGDRTLRDNLARHIGPLTVRLAYRMNLENPLLDDVISRYPLAFSLAREGSRILADRFSCDVSDDEVGYLALSFALALEQQRRSDRRAKNVLIVCASGLGSAQLLAMRVREQLGDYLGAIGTCDVAQLSHIDFSDIDCVFSTVPIRTRLPVPVHEVGFFFDKEDAAGLKWALESADRDEVDPRRYFDPRLFLAHLPARDRDGVLDALCDQACRVLGMSSELRSSVAEREAVAPTAFGNRVAMPHPLRAMARETAVVVGLLDEPVSWGGKEVQAVFLILVSTSPCEDLKPFYELMLSLSSSPERMDALLADQRYEPFLAQLSSISSPGGEGGGSP